MNKRDDNLIPALAEDGGEPLLGSGFEAEQPDSDSDPEQTQPAEEGSR